MSFKVRMSLWVYVHMCINTPVHIRESALKSRKFIEKFFPGTSINLLDPEIFVYYRSTIILMKTQIYCC